MARLRIPKLRRGDPRSPVTGTSYTATGSTKPQTANYTELGSQQGTRIQDPVPGLGVRQQAVVTYTKMVRSDASVRVSLRAGKAPVLGAEYYVEPYSDDPQDLAIAEFVEHNLFNGMSTPYLRFIEQALKMYENGFSAFEEVWEQREWAPKKSTPGANRKQYTMLRKLAVRPATTISKFTYDDNGGPLEMEQTAIDSEGKAKQVTIPIDKLVVFSFDQDGGDIEGNSILRSAYPHWYYKDHLYKIDAIQKERHGIGVPEVELQPGYGEADRLIAHQLASNLRTNEKAYIVRTTMMKVGFAELQGQLVNALESAQHHDTMIMKNIMVQFLNAGVDSSGGGRATSATAMDMFLKAMKYVANVICDCINMYVVPKLVGYNFDTDRFPKLSVRNIGETKDLQMFAAAMKNLIDVNAITVDDATENWIRDQVDMARLIGTRPAVAKTDTTDSKDQPPVDPTSNGHGKVLTGNVGKSPSSGAV